MVVEGRSGQGETRQAGPSPQSLLEKVSLGSCLIFSHTPPLPFSLLLRPPIHGVSGAPAEVFLAAPPGPSRSLPFPSALPWLSTRPLRALNSDLLTPAFALLNSYTPLKSLPILPHRWTHPPFL